VINQGYHQIQNYTSTKKFRFLSSLVFDPRGMLEAWDGMLGVLVRNLRAMREVNWVNGSGSSGASSPRWSSIKSR